MSWDALSGGQKAVAILIGMVALVAIFGQSDPEPSATRYAPPAVSPAKKRDDDMALMACLAAQREVKKLLKAPATADFPSCASSMHEYKINANDARTKFGVQGYVDSQNSFGANVRSRFVVLMDKGPGDGSRSFTVTKAGVE